MLSRSEKPSSRPKKATAKCTHSAANPLYVWALPDRISLSHGRLAGTSKITDKNIETALKEVRRSLLEADVNLAVRSPHTTQPCAPPRCASTAFPRCGSPMRCIRPTPHGASLAGERSPGMRQCPREHQRSVALRAGIP
jgi:hypothetical protein